MDKSLLSEQAQNNLVELAAYLKSHHKDWVKPNTSEDEGELVGFDLWNFFYSGSENKEHKCGSTACAVGHFAVMRGYEARKIGVYVTENTVGENGFISDGNRMLWADFSADIIGVDAGGRQRIIWNWIFSSHWVGFDNSALGVAARIGYFLEYGIPYEFSAIEISDMDEERARYIINLYSHIKDALEAECAGE